MKPAGLFALALLLLATAGCASIAGRGFPRVQLDYQHVESEASGWAVAREWIAGAPARGAVSAGHCCGSMLPHIRGGQILLLLPVDSTPMAPGSVAIYRDPAGAQKTIVHAVAEDNGRSVLFFGTNNRRSDGWVDRDLVLWRVVAVVTWPGVGQPIATP